MAAFLLKRIGQGAGLLAAMSLIAFLGIFALGNPLATLVNPDSSPEVLARTAAQLGLDQPMYRQYLRFVGNLLHGDMGSSYINGQPALGLILERFPATLELALAAMLIATAVGIPLGMYAGCRPRSVVGRGVGGLAVLMVSVPTFWLGLALIIVFGIEQHWLPTGGRGQVGSLLGLHTSLATIDGWRHLLLPAFNLSLFPMALLIRLTRAGVIESLDAPFTRFARAKGLDRRRIVGVYVLRNILTPIVTVMGMVFGMLLAFSVVTESIFAWPGTGKLVIEAIRTSDRPVVISYLLFTVSIFVLVNIAADILCALLDPRVAAAQGVQA
ncbi:ABC transporter permease [Bordetella genomosp. 9]|uniref:ABC transporter permease n=1 Tax=Bordetella genomosp. 9 TaxID=1416803 RepID=A0A261R2C3_9BORD|nr:ABC transporter permease [Bordetella genomosp. 9]OZI18802.1 ABC transporter permease [Bordetella genomosp. 9]